MGTWQAPQTKEERKQLRKKLKDLAILRDEISVLFGNDSVWDGFDVIETPIKNAVRSKWTKTDHRTDDCKHPAFYGDAPGVCALCRMNLPESE